MKHLLLLCLIVAGPLMKGNKINQQNPLEAYAGKYSMTVNGKTGQIEISAKGDHLVLHETWTGDDFNLKHLSGDNFMMEKREWPITFNRDNTKKIVSVLVTRVGKDLWTKD